MQEPPGETGTRIWEEGRGGGAHQKHSNKWVETPTERECERAGKKEGRDVSTHQAGERPLPSHNPW